MPNSEEALPFEEPSNEFSLPSNDFQGNCCIESPNFSPEDSTNSGNSAKSIPCSPACSERQEAKSIYEQPL